MATATKHAAVKDPSNNAVRVEIFDQAYNLRGSDAEYILKLAEYVDGKMRAVAEQTHTVDTARLAVLAALNIADEYHLLKRNQDAGSSDYLKRAHSIFPACWMKYWKKSAKRDNAVCVRRTLLSAAFDFDVQHAKNSRSAANLCGASLARQPRAAVPTWLGPASKSSLTKVAGKPIANFLGPPYCQCGDVYPSILTESRPAGLVMAVTDF